MYIARRSFLAQTIGAAAAGLTSCRSVERTPVLPDYERRVFNLERHVRDPVQIESIALLQNGSRYFVRARSTDGAEGLARTKQVEDFIPILLRRVIPSYLGKDARQLESLIDDVYRANYKMAGQALWCPVAYVEQSLWDLLGKIAGKSVSELMGGRRRSEIPVYLSGSGRNTTAEEEVDIYVRGVEETGARAVKFKIGGRMSRNRDSYPGRTEALLELARKKLGDDIRIFVDANGSYNSTKAIAIGRRLEDLGVGFFEEPCPWEELGETKAVADALNLPIAAGEQDASLWRFQWMMTHRVMEIPQPDINYNGGFVRTARVARMASEQGMKITPHNTQTGPGAANMLHFAASTKNIGDYMEFPWRRSQQTADWFSPSFLIRKGQVRVPRAPGLGVEIATDYLRKAREIRL